VSNIGGMAASVLVAGRFEMNNTSGMDANVLVVAKLEISINGGEEFV